MLIYTGNATGKDLDVMAELGIGVMVCTTPKGTINNRWKDFPLALDNGAFGCWRRGFPFMRKAFEKTIENCYSAGFSLNFIVCPDLVARGRESLDFSYEWALGELLSCNKLALAVQDGMTEQMVSDRYPERRFSHIFIGGTPEWKWRTAASWVEFAHSRSMECHIGRCGTLERLRYAEEIGADSVDSTNFVRNKSWDTVAQFLEGTKQQSLFTEREAV